MIYTVKYKYGAEEYCVSGEESVSDGRVLAAFAKTTESQGERYVLEITPLAGEIELLFAGITFSPKTGAGAFFVNGWQSWTESGEYGKNKRQKGMAFWRGLLARKGMALDAYGDYSFYGGYGKKGSFHSYTYTYLRYGGEYSLWGSLSEKEGFTVFEYSYKTGKLTARRDCAGRVTAKAYKALDIVNVSGGYDAAFDAYFALQNLPPARPKIRGYTSWYNHYQNIDEQLLIRNLEAFTEKNIPCDVFQIDDGWQTAVGDWIVDTGKFPSGLRYLADRIHETGAEAGLWLAPFVAETKSEIFRTRPDWFLRDNNEPVCSGANWSRQYALDFENENVKEHLRRIFDTVFNEWGFGLVKLDFLYAAAMRPTRRKTRGEIMREAMEFLRSLAGGRLILGCGVPLGSASGLVDYCRIGCDVTFTWNGIWYERGVIAERPSSRAAVHNAFTRRGLNGRAFINDPDVFFLRDMRLSPKHRAALINAVQYGGVAFVSDDLFKYTGEQAAELRELFTEFTAPPERAP